MAESRSGVSVRHIFFIHSSVDAHSGCLHVLAIVSSAAVNTEVHISFWIMVFFRHLPRSGVARLQGSSIFSFLRHLHSVLHSNHTNVRSHQQHRRFPFSLHPLPHLLFLEFFDDGHSDWCDVILHCRFYLHFSNSDVEHLFMCFLAICMSSLKKCLYRSSAHFWIGLFCLFCWYWAAWVVCIVWRLIPCQSLGLQIFSSILCTFCFVYGFLCCAKDFEFN